MESSVVAHHYNLWDLTKHSFVMHTFLTTNFLCSRKLEPIIIFLLPHFLLPSTQISDGLGKLSATSGLQPDIELCAMQA